MKSTIDPSPLLQMITAYWSSAALFAGNELGVFTALAAGPASAEDLAVKLGVDTRALRLVLQALAGLRLLAADGDRFANTPLAEAFLVEGRPGFLGRAIQYGADSYGLWGGLTGVVRDGRPPAGAEEYLGNDPERTRHFVHAMHERALGVARAVVGAIDLPPATRLLDLGGGPGTYSVLLAHKVPGLQAVVLDLPPIVAIAEEIIASLGLQDRVRVHPGNFLTDAYPAGHDAALLSGILHRESDSTCREIVRRAGESLPPGGRIVISDVMLDADRVNPPFATLFGVHMLVSSERGGVHSTADHQRWLEHAGFTEIAVRPMPAPGVHTVITATKRR